MTFSTNNRMIVLIIIATAVLLGGITFSGNTVLASSGLPSSILDPLSVGWISQRTWTSSDFGNQFDTYKDQGYMVIDIEVDELNGDQRVSAVWQYNTDNRDWASIRNLTSQQFNDKWNELKDQGYRLQDQESYVLNGNRYYAGVWIQNKESLAWSSRRNLTSQQFSDDFQAYKDDYIMIDFEAYVTGDGLRYAAVWLENEENLDWIELRDMSGTQYGNYFQQYASQGYRVHEVESYYYNGTQYYAAIWFKNTNGRGWAAFRDMSAQGYANKWNELWDKGYRATNIEVYDSANGTRYAGVWRQNTDRPYWQHRVDVDALLEGNFNSTGVAGMSVAVAHDGQMVYLRGLGHADIASNKDAHSRTIYRAASVSKAIGGVLAMDLQEDGLINLNNPSSTYIAGLPDHHTHDVWQLIANRSGIGHYGDYGSLSINMYGQYNTALGASTLFWNDPLTNTVGTYDYSTPAYTLLGAALEGVTGQSIHNLVNLNLNQRYGLSSMRSEDRSQPNFDRATIYGGSNSVINPADNLSWKVLGGGIEVSPYDLTRMGNMLLNGTILNQQSLNIMWTQPDNQNNYAYGWNTGTDQCADVVAKAGSQPGGLAYTRIYPDLDIVISVMANNRDTGLDLVQIGRDIGTLMLNVECQNVTPTPSPTTPAPTTPAPTTPAPTTPAPVDLVWSAPTGTITEFYGDPVYQWEPEAGAQTYSLYIHHADDIYASVFYEENLDAATYCTTSCTVDAVSLSPSNWLSNGDYTVWMNVDGGTWSEVGSFSIAAPQPSVVTLGETADTDTANPVLHWTLEGNAAAASWFQLYLAPTDDITNPVLSTWVHREAACVDMISTVCNHVITEPLVSGVEYSLYIQSWGPGGMSSGGIAGWAGPETFTPGPQAVSGLSVNIVDSVVTLTWDGTAALDYYQVWVGVLEPAVEQAAFVEWQPASTFGCAGGGTCSLTLTTPLSAGTYNWFVQSYDDPVGLTVGGYLNTGWAQGPDIVVP